MIEHKSDCASHKTASRFEDCDTGEGRCYNHYRLACTCGRDAKILAVFEAADEYTTARDAKYPHFVALEALRKVCAAVRAAREVTP